MSTPQSIDVYKLTQFLKGLRSDTTIPTDFKSQVAVINHLLKNDKTGIVTTIYDFMNNTASVPMKLESENDTLNDALDIWQNEELNKDIGIDIPRGLRELSTQYYAERWKSSFVALNIKWETKTVGNIKNLVVPSKMWINDGGNITVKDDTGDLSSRRYFMGKGTKNPLEDTNDKSVIIRKPYDSWYDPMPTPYLVRKGVLYNALFKIAIVSKQSDVIQAIIPYIFAIKAGNDKLAEMGMLAGEEDLKELKQAFLKAKQDNDFAGSLGDFIGTFNYDVDMEHLIPDLTKILSSANTQSADRAIMAGLGLVELEGFSKSRQETILNPKVLVEEIKDGVKDWTLMVKEVMQLMKEKNLRKHPKLFKNEIRVAPSTIKAFVTEDTKSLIRSLYDRGTLSKQTTVEETLDFEFDVEIDRVRKEKEQGLDELMYPPIIQNLEQNGDENLEDQDKKPDTPEADNFNNAIINNIKKEISAKIIKDFKNKKL